jgi:hypothetical protein
VQRAGGETAAGLAKPPASASKPRVFFGFQPVPAPRAQHTTQHHAPKVRDARAAHAQHCVCPITAAPFAGRLLDPPASPISDGSTSPMCRPSRPTDVSAECAPRQRLQTRRSLHVQRCTCSAAAHTCGRCTCMAARWADDGHGAQRQQRLRAHIHSCSVRGTTHCTPRTIRDGSVARICAHLSLTAAASSCPLRASVSDCSSPCSHTFLQHARHHTLHATHHPRWERGSHLRASVSDCCRVLLPFVSGHPPSRSLQCELRMAASSA